MAPETCRPGLFCQDAPLGVFFVLVEKSSLEKKSPEEACHLSCYPVISVRTLRNTRHCLTQQPELPHVADATVRTRQLFFDVFPPPSRVPEGGEEAHTTGPKRANDASRPLQS